MFVIAVMTLVGLLCVLNLVLTLGVVKRLRHHSELLSGQSQTLETPGYAMLPAGSSPPAFQATTVTGQKVSSAELSGTTLLAFFSPECSMCRQVAPQFAAYVAGFAKEERRALAVVVGREDETQELVASLGDDIPVVLEPPGGAVSSAYEVRGFPCLGVVTDGGTVLESDLTLARLRATVSV